VSRAYRSARREQAAELTRRAIVDAARRVFIERGYAGATIAAVAQAADVAVPTVYASVGGKSALLMALLDDIDEQGGVPSSTATIHPLSNPDEVVRNAVSNPEEVIRNAVQLTRRVNEQSGDIIAVLDAAAQFEPEAAAAVDEGIRRHRAGWLGVAERLQALGALSPGLNVQVAADTLSILTNFRVWRTLVRDYGWSWSAAADWVTSQAQRTVLAGKEP
jgi:AcrR family transcriptional regulator